MFAAGAQRLEILGLRVCHLVTCLCLVYGFILYIEGKRVPVTAALEVHLI